MALPSDETPKSLGDGATGSDVGSPGTSSAQSLGDRSTAGDIGSSVSDLDEVVVGLEDDLEIVDLAARYEIRETLGRGGMGEVFLAIDGRLDRPVAIKRLREELGDSRKASQRFLTEAKSIAALNHFNIVQIHDYGRAADGPFIVMEYVGGGSLAERLKQGPLELEEAIKLGCQLCDALGAAHRQGIIHRDIKPANVLMTAEGMPKLTDFGLARQEGVDGGQTRAGAVMGTLDYMSPEQREDATQTDARSDLWSLAATLYQVVSGEVPRVIVMEQVPDRLRGVLEAALKMSPEDRFQSAEEFRDALRGAGVGGVGDVSDLGEGECPACGVKNESSRKYCRNCAISLEVECLSCRTSIAMWEDVCGGCGTRQSELVERRREAMQSQQEQAESDREGYRYSEAIAIAEAVRDEPDLRLQQLQSWAEPFIEEVGQEEEQQRERTGKLVEEARAHLEAHDYPAGIHALEQVPEPLRGGSVLLGDGETGSVDRLLSRLRDRQESSQRLDADIRDRVKRRELDGLLEDVEALLQLRPDRRDLPKLREQLQRHESRRQEKLLQQYRLEIRQARQAGEIDELSVLVERYLRLKPDDEKMLALQGQVEDRLNHEREVREQQQAEQQAAQRRKSKRLIKLAVAVGGVALLVVVIGLSWNEWQSAEQVAAERGTTGTAVSGSKENRKPSPSGPSTSSKTAGPVKKPMVLKGHSLRVNSVSFSPNGKRIVSGGGYRTAVFAGLRGVAKVWDISSLDTSK